MCFLMSKNQYTSEKRVCFLYIKYIIMTTNTLQWELEINSISTKIVYIQTAVQNLLNETELYVYIQKETIFSILDLETSESLFEVAQQLVKDKVWYTLYRQEPLLSEDTYENYVRKYEYEKDEYHDKSQQLFFQLFPNDFDDIDWRREVLYQIVLEYLEKYTNLLSFTDNVEGFIVSKEIKITWLYFLDTILGVLGISENFTWKELLLLQQQLDYFFIENIDKLIKIFQGQTFSPEIEILLLTQNYIENNICKLLKKNINNWYEH